MERGTFADEPSSPQVTRRGFLTATALTAGAVAGAPLLAACGTSSGGQAGTTSSSTLAKILPSYAPHTAAKPDIASVNGSDPAYLHYPSTLTRTVTEKPGAGSTYQVITPIFGSTPPASNQYYKAVNEALGAELVMQPANGATYNTVLPPLFAGNKLPDWIDIPSWNNGNVNLGEGVADKFADLTPFLAGDKAHQYPNLANVAPAAWQAGVWHNKIYGIPVFPSNVVFAGALFYRADLLSSMGISPDVKSAADLLALAKEVNDPKRKRWAFDDLWSYLSQPFNVPNVPPNWATNSKGDLIATWETEQIIEQMNWLAGAVKAGLMHPDAIAFQSSSAKQRFYSGQVVITGDGTGAWNGSDAVAGRAANAAYVRRAFAPFTASGTGTPRIALGNGAALFSYLNKRLSKKQIEECLRIANFLAAPYGSYEYTLVTFGVPKVDYTMGKYGPAYTGQGNINVAPTTFPFLATGPSVTYVQSGYVDVAREYALWQGAAAKYKYKPLFYDMNVTVPASLNKALYPTVFTAATGNMMQNVVRGRNSIADYRAAVKSWQRAGGGNDLRRFFEGIRAKYGDA
jgi:putative aldouronate transport system substrate-binding protein